MVSKNKTITQSYNYTKLDEVNAYFLQDHILPFIKNILHPIPKSSMIQSISSVNCSVYCLLDIAAKNIYIS